MSNPLSILCIFISFILSFNSYAAKGVYQTSSQFISNAFLGKEAEVKMLWLSTEDKRSIADILQHKYSRMRIRYWQEGEETVWILDEIGKEKPITIGVHIKEHRINHFKVLTFRESRGHEVRHDFYAKQFLNAELLQNNLLSNHIDGITGATMSVSATKKTARLALWLHAKVINHS